MSRLWDTPEFWARSEADEMLREMDCVAPGAMADSFERTAQNYDGDLEMAAMIVAELRRRADAGIRFWPGPQPITADPDNPTECRATAPADDDGSLIDDEIPW